MEPAVVDVTIMHHNFRMELHLDHLSQQLIYGALMVQSVPYEREVTELVCRILEPGDTFVDVGAHIGWYTVLASRIIGQKGRVLAIEPDARNCKWLQRNIDINDINGNVSRHRVAATAKSEMIMLYTNLDNDGGHALWPPKHHPYNEKTMKDQQTVMVEGITIDDLCRQEQVEEIKLLKIDTEGAEVEVLIGAGELLRSRKIKHVIAEVNQFGLAQMGTNAQRMIRLMEGFGYIFSDVGNKGDEFIYNILFSVKA